MIYRVNINNRFYNNITTGKLFLTRIILYFTVKT